MTVGAPGARRSLVVACLLAATLAPLARAQVMPPAPTGLVNTGLVSGIIEDSLATPIAGARLSIVGLGGHGVSADDGTFRLGGIQPGQHTLVARRIGFRPESVAVSITAGIVSEIRVRLRPAAQWVAPVVIDARSTSYTGLLRGFYERRDRGLGLYFTAQDIEKRDPRFITDLIRGIPGARVIPRGHETVVTFRDMRCLPLVWIDGMAASTGYLDPDVFDPRTLAGIEIYKGPATVPSALMGVRGKGSCGVIALWTKRSDPIPKAPGKPVTADDLANLVASLSLYTADQVDQPAAADAEHPLSPLYPDELRTQGVAGRVVVEFVVDTGGNVEMNTFGIVSTTHTPFAEAVRRAVAYARFRPAILEGRPVRQLVQIPVTFTVPGP